VTSRIPFSRQLLAKAQAMVQVHFPEIQDASLTHCGNCWMFEGPDKYSWLGRAHNAYHARYLGWMAWLSSKGVVELIGGQVFCRPLQHHSPIGLDDRGIAEVDLDAERRLDVWKVRSVQPKPDHVRPSIA
jgi:hypothetical protein